jgi:hypothetical protein
MSPRPASQSVEGGGRTASTPHACLIASVFVLAALQGAALAQAPPPPLPVPAIGDLAAVTRCLTGEGCTRRATGTESVPPSACAADVAVKTMPELLRADIRAFAKSEAAARCDAADDVIAPLSEKIGKAYEGGPTSTLTPEQAAAARNYADACLSPELLGNAGPLTDSEQAYLREAVGLIVERRNPAWGGPRPICTAVAMGRFVVTARSCLPAAVTAQIGRGAYLEGIAFRFFNRPTLYGLSLHRFGSEVEPALDPDHDFALLETVAAPELWQSQGSIPRLGTIRLNEDLFALSSDIFLRVTAGVRGGADLDFSSATRIHHNILCRPAHIAPNGLFLHACRMASVVTRGTPLFQRQEGQLAFVGIHSGTTASLDDRSLASCAPGLPNYGIAIPPALIVRTFLK